MDSIQWRETQQAVPEIQQIIQVLELTTGIENVGVGRQAEVAHTVAQVRGSTARGGRGGGGGAIGQRGPTFSNKSQSSATSAELADPGADCSIVKNGHCCNFE
jgi:hypothetical protein